ncbi:MAG TPA: HAMP domain-containing sensor histidine kinase [Solirubrobacteraceae bacterium]|nr:HAMP domain-containing sensor histidine kinase [Solirubrobacteraceae bacterium]
MSLRGRVLAYLSVAAVASCALTVVVGAVLVRDRIAARQAAQLRNQAVVVALVGGPPGARRVGEHVYRAGEGRPTRAGRRLTRAVLGAIPPGDAQGTIHVGHATLIYAARMSALGRIVLVRRAALPFAEWRPFLASLVLAGLGGTLLAALLAFVLARRLTRPIAALAQATRRLASGAAAVTVPAGDGTDELSELGRSFNRMSGELQRARDAERAFLESVSHELKTPLTSVRGYAEALQEGAVSAADGGRIIAAEARRLDRLVSDLIDLARLGRAGFRVERAAVDLRAVARDVVARHEARARELGVELSVVAGAHASGQGDGERLLQATSNLVENALRLTPRGGRVTVCAGPGELVVTDTGPGLAEEDLPRAFERFYLHDRYRADPERAVGSGLGLAIVGELVAAMGGRVSAANRPGGGASFRIGLAPPPARDGPPPAA